MYNYIYNIAIYEIASLILQYLEAFLDFHILFCNCVRDN